MITRDWRSKDNNASCAIGPFLRLFDDGFTLADAKATEIALDITGPDGFVLFTGTMFAPTEDRDQPGEGFTHKIGDVVRISSPRLGALTNVVNTTEDAQDWRFGITALMENLAARGVLSSRTQARS